MFYPLFEWLNYHLPWNIANLNIIVCIVVWSKLPVIFGMSFIFYRKVVLGCPDALPECATTH